MTIRGVVFDAAGTLIYPQPGVIEAYRLIGLRFGADVPTAAIAERFRLAFAELFQNNRYAKQPTSDEQELRQWKTLVQRVFPDVVRGDELFAALWDHFAQAGHWRCFDDVAPCLEWLASQSLTVAIASNFDSRLLQILPGLPPLAKISKVFFSASLGLAKPQAAFFSQVAEQLRLLPNELLMVGDSFELDFQGARQAGWHAVWLDRDDSGIPVTRDTRIEGWDCDQAEISLESLQELPGWLARFEA